jgi:hypothetical protein
VKIYSISQSNTRYTLNRSQPNQQQTRDTVYIHYTGRIKQNKSIYDYFLLLIFLSPILFPALQTVRAASSMTSRPDMPGHSKKFGNNLHYLGQLWLDAFNPESNPNLLERPKHVMGFLQSEQELENSSIYQDFLKQNQALTVDRINKYPESAIDWYSYINEILWPLAEATESSNFPAVLKVTLFKQLALQATGTAFEQMKLDPKNYGLKPEYQDPDNRPQNFHFLASCIAGYSRAERYKDNTSLWHPPWGPEDLWCAGPINMLYEVSGTADTGIFKEGDVKITIVAMKANDILEKEGTIAFLNFIQKALLEKREAPL